MYGYLFWLGLVELALMLLRAGCSAELVLQSAGEWVVVLVLRAGE